MGRGAAAILLLATLCPAASAQSPPEVRPGGLVIWRSAEGIGACTAFGRTWRPLDGACYFPIDLGSQGEVQLERARAGETEKLSVRVGDYPYPTQVLEVEDRMVHLSKEDLERVRREAELVKPLWEREGEPAFSLPLLAPLDPLPGGGSFGARRVFNGEPKSPHAGADYKAASGTPVRAAEGGIVALTGDHFFAGKSVYVDHGGGLITMYYHLSRIAATEGERVERGQALGEVGATGRVTGPHLHFAVRWHGARIDPDLLLGRAADAPPLAIGEPAAVPSSEPGP